MILPDTVSLHCSLATPLRSQLVQLWRGLAIEILHNSKGSGIENSLGFESM